MKAKDLSSEVIESSLISYAKRSIPGLPWSIRQPAGDAAGRVSAAPLRSEAEQRELLETVVSNLTEKKKGDSAGLVNARFLFGLLRTANILRSSEASRTKLEKRIALKLENAALDDLLIPSYSYLVETLYDVDCVERIVGYFVENLEKSSATTAGSMSTGEFDNINNKKLFLVGKLVDGYLSEIATDANLKPEKFCDIALALPDHARVFNDGLYRAVDVYLKAHPRITEEEREKVCVVMDCQKLTLEACTHAAQNERLPLRAVVQVLFLEQLQLRRAIEGTVMEAEAQVEEDEEEKFTVTVEENEVGTWRAAVRENQVLRLDMDSMRIRVQGLERECSSMRKAIARMDRAAGGWALLTRKFGCKFAAQFCDLH